MRIAALIVTMLAVLATIGRAQEKGTGVCASRAGISSARIRAAADPHNPREAGYDEMCRLREYQDFVFVRGAFAGTLSPQPMDSRADGSLSRVFIQGAQQLTAEYERYAKADPLCCPSRTTGVVFDVTNDPPAVHPVPALTNTEWPGIWCSPALATYSRKYPDRKLTATRSSVTL